MEALAHLAPPIRSLDAPLTSKARRLRFSRSCYDHLAGRLGVAVAAQLEARGYLVAADQKQYAVTTAGHRWCRELGIDVAALKPTAAGVARRCLDWTERRHHLAGPLGTALMARFIDLDGCAAMAQAARSASLRSGFPSCAVCCKSMLSSCSIRRPRFRSG
jgi:hypothetical protein